MPTPEADHLGRDIERIALEIDKRDPEDFGLADRGRIAYAVNLLLGAGVIELPTIVRAVQ